MIIHADMPCFGEYKVSLNRVMITPQVYMADDVHGVVITRNWSSAFGGFVYEHKRGEVRIIHAKTKRADRRTDFGRKVTLRATR